MNGVKFVDKYELLAQKAYEQDRIKIIPARHIVENKLYSLKKLKLNDQNKEKYLSLMNQIAILKELNDERVIICHKLLKTATSIYVSYDYISENSLQTFVQKTKDTIQPAEKLKIALKISEFFLFLKANNIVNLNIKPTNIQLLQKQRELEKDVRFNNFEYSFFIHKSVPDFFVKWLPNNDFLPPETQRSQPKIGHHCSVYILGKILSFLGLGKGTNDEKNKQNLQLLSKFMDKMMSINENQRPELQQVIICLKKLCQENKQKKHLAVNSIQKNIQISRSNTHIGLQRQHNSGLMISRSKSLRSEGRSFDEQLSKKNAYQYCLGIIKKRNLALFLLKCCEIITNINLIDYNTAVQLSFLFLKKSTIIMSQLSKFMFNGRHPEIHIPQKQFVLFNKTPDFFRLQSIVSKNFNFSKKYLNLMLENIVQHYPDLLQNQLFSQQTLSQDINNQYFNEKIRIFLNQCSQSRRLSQVSKNTLKYLLFISYVCDFHSYEQMFNQLINQEIIQLQKQTLFVKLSQMEKQIILSKLMEALQKINQRSHSK